MTMPKEGDPAHCSLCLKRWREAGCPMPDSLMQAILEKYDLPGTTSEADAIEHAYEAGKAEGLASEMKSPPKEGSNG